MNFKSVLNDVCCDNRIKNGVIDLKNADHVFVLQEYLEKVGFDIETIVNKTAQLFEAGKFPDRQAYNKDGILVTFPNKEYRDRAINKGTHFAENPKKGETNIFTQPPVDIEQKPEEPKGSVPIDTELEKKADDESEDSYEDRTPKEKVVDAQAVDYILTGETPLVNYSVDEAKRCGFYNKGLVWYDSNGNLIGEQIFDEKAKKPIIKKTSSALGKILEKTKRNPPVLETIPLLKSLGVNDYQSLVNFVKGGFLDKYDFTKEGYDWVKSVLPYINESNAEEFFNFFNVAAGTTTTLNDIAGKPDSFIHKKIKEYRSILKSKTATEKDSKENTSDVILIYGGTMDTLLNKLKSISSEQDLLLNKNGTIGFKNDPNLKFAQISLKAGDAKLGKITKKLFSILGQKEPLSENLNEGFGGSVTSFISSIKDKLSAVTEFVSTKMSTVYNWFISKLKSFYASVENIFRNIPIDDIIKQDKELEKLTTNLEIANESSISSINEKKDDLQQYIPITNCNYNAMKMFYNYYNRIDYKHLLQNYNGYNSIKKAGGFKVKINSIDQTRYESIDDVINMVYEDFEDAAKSKNYFKENVISEAKTCIPTGKFISRENLEPVLKLRANHIALRKIDELIKSILKNSSNTEINIKDLPTIAATLSGEAVFGNNVNLPLFKFTGNSLTLVGTKQNYVSNKIKEFSNVKLDEVPLGFIHIYPTQKTDTLHFQTLMYLLFDLEDVDGKITPMYSVINFTVGSGSKFAFNIEMNDVLSIQEIQSKFK